MFQWFSGTNAVLIDSCEALDGVEVKIGVSEDLYTVDGDGFSLQLNCHPVPGTTGIEQELNWLQYILFIGLDHGLATRNWQAWAIGATAWPKGYNVPPGSTNPTQPVPPFPGPDQFITNVPSNRLPKGSALLIKLQTNSTHLVTSATFMVQLPGQAMQSQTLNFPPSTPSAPNANAQFAISGFQLDSSALAITRGQSSSPAPAS